MLPLLGSHTLVSETDRQNYLTNKGIAIEGQAGSALIVCNDGRRLKVDVLNTSVTGTATIPQLNDAQWIETAEKVAIILVKKGLLGGDYKESNFIINKDGITLPDTHNRFIEHDDEDDANGIENTEDDSVDLFDFLNTFTFIEKHKEIKIGDRTPVPLIPIPKENKTEEAEEQFDDSDLPVDEKDDAVEAPEVKDKKAAPIPSTSEDNDTSWTTFNGIKNNIAWYLDALSG